jgi:tetratricopeptide (TPR) repeat protein
LKIKIIKEKEMRKIINFVLLLAIVFLIMVVFKDKSRRNELLKLKSVKQVEGDVDIQKLKKEVSKYEDLLSNKIKTSDKLGPVYKDLGKKYLEKNSWQLAIQALEKAIAHGNSSVRVNHMLGTAHANLAKATNNQKGFKKSIFYYKQALKLKPAFYEARYGLALVQYYGVKDKNEAVKSLKRVVADMPRFYEA